VRPRLHVILSSVGTDGDIFPFIRLGTELIRRGHRATLVASEDYQARAVAEGLGFAPLVSRQENESCFGHPDFWHPLKGAAVASQWGARFLRRQYELLAALARGSSTVLVSSPGVLAARLVQETLGTPLVSVILQPWMIQSSLAPPVMPHGLTLPRWAPRPVAALYWRSLDAVGALLVGRQLGRLRRSLYLPPVRHMFRWWLSPQLALGMFPDWYGPPQADWPGQVRLVGFPLADADRERGDIDTNLSAFLAGGPPPVAFTFGTGMRHGAALFRAAVEACRATGMRGVLLTRHPRQLPSTLPATVLHVAQAPFRWLFPRCRLVVHHGGIGTVAEALAAAVPQVVVPVAYDQTDNAVRVTQLGLGQSIAARRLTPARLASAIARTGDGSAHFNSRWSSRLRIGESLSAAAAEIERLASRSRQ